MSLTVTSGILVVRLLLPLWCLCLVSSGALVGPLLGRLVVQLLVKLHWLGLADGRLPSGCYCWLVLVNGPLLWLPLGNV